MATSLRWTKHSRFQSFLLIGLFFFFLAHLLLLSPSSLEDDFGGMRVIHPRDLLGFLKNEPETLAPQPFLKSTTPNYSLRDSTLLSTQAGEPKLKLKSRKTNLYQSQHVAQMRDVQAELQDRTQIESKEAIYELDQSKITFLGSVKTTFPRGAVIRSELAIVTTRPTLHILIPTDERVEGTQTDDVQQVFFESMGMEYSETDQGTLQLLSQVRVNLKGPRRLEIRSDQAQFEQSNGILHFHMSPLRLIEQQFVTAQEPEFKLKSRTLDLRLAEGRQLEELLAYRDVWFEDLKSDQRETRGTGGKALYRVSKNAITLTDFPQLYQDRDTVTGDSITYHRDTDTVEVKESNAIYNNSKSESP